MDFDTILREELEYQGVPSIVASALRFFWFTRTGESIDELTAEQELCNDTKIRDGTLDGLEPPRYR